MIWALGAFLDNPAASSHHSGYKGMDSRTTQGIYILPNCCKKPSLECAETNIPPDHHTTRSSLNTDTRRDVSIRFHVVYPKLWLSHQSVTAEVNTMQPFFFQTFIFFSFKTLTFQCTLKRKFRRSDCANRPRNVFHSSIIPDLSGPLAECSVTVYNGQKVEGWMDIVPEVLVLSCQKSNHSVRLLL